MKKILFRIAFGIVVLIVLAGLVVFFSLNTIVKRGVEKIGPMITKVEVKLGAAEISPFGGTGRLTKLFVGNPEGYKTPSAMEFGDIKVGVQIGSVMSQTIVVNEVTVKDAVITLEGTLKGNNLTKILDNVNGSSAEAGNQPKPKGAPPEEPGASNSSKKFIVKDITIAGTMVNVAIDLPVVGHQSMSLPLPPVHIQNIGVCAENFGVTAEQLTQAIMKPLVSSILDAVEQKVASMGGGLKDIGKGGTDSINKAAKGVTDGCFKKNPYQSPELGAE